VLGGRPPGELAAAVLVLNRGGGSTLGRCRFVVLVVAEVLVAPLGVVVLDVVSGVGLLSSPLCSEIGVFPVA
jgi:hypothetical protein